MPSVPIVSRRTKPRTVSFQVEESIANDLDALKKRVKANRDVDFNLHGVMEAALKKTIKKATAALDTLEAEDRKARSVSSEQGATGQGANRPTGSVDYPTDAG